jgi:2-hydroxy-4-carboxymuconate semialdehyde hemiacetal dehydrogenase
VSGVDVAINGIELQDRAFVQAIVSGVEPRTGFAKVLPAYETLDRIEPSPG